MRNHTKTIIALSILPQILLVKWLSYYPELVETYYSNGLYIVLSRVFRFVFGWIPFSVGDLLYTIAIIYAIKWSIFNRKRILKDTMNWFKDVLVAVSLLYFVFHLFWGMNYYRLPLHRSLGLEKDYTTEELIAVTEKLTRQSNQIHLQLSSNDTIKVTVPYTKKELISNSSQGYETLSQIYPKLNPLPKSVKRSIYSLPSTYFGIGGYLNPFTNEGQINSLSPLHKFPNTVCHEQAHQIGFAAENESNFIGSLAAMHSDNPYFQYSGYIFALKHCLLEIERRDEDKFNELVENVNKGILKNYQEEYEFYLTYKNPLQPIFDATFNQFLKANNQDKGIESYSYVVALYVSHFKDKSN